MFPLKLKVLKKFSLVFLSHLNPKWVPRFNILNIWCFEKASRRYLKKEEGSKGPKRRRVASWKTKIQKANLRIITNFQISNLTTI